MRMSTPGNPPDPGQPPRKPAPTLIENPQGSIREALQEVRSQARARPTVVEPGPPPAPRPQGQSRPAAAPAESDAAPYRPQARPPMGLLVAVDDGLETGEVFRVRGPRFVIGRVSGDLVIPHDEALSGQHAEIVRRWDGGRYTWHIADLKSRNGTFFRVAKVLLAHQREIVLGGRIYRFELPQAPTPGGPEGPPLATRKWQVGGAGPVPSPFRPALVEVSGGARHELADDNWVGRDPAACSIAIDDPMLNPRHARIHRADDGRWLLTEDAPTRNRVWIRLGEAPLGRDSQFQCGEQRFRFEAL